MVCINVDSTSLVKSDNNVITGILSVSVNDFYFPDKDWNDFIVIVLSWWAKESITLLDSNRKVVFDFMDGPFNMVINPIDGGQLLELNFYKKEKLLPSADKLIFDKFSFLKNLASVCNSVLRECQNMNIKTVETEELDSLFKMLQSRIKQ